VGEEALGLGQRGHRLADGGEALAVDALDLDELAVGLDREAAGCAREAAGREDVVGPGRVVTGRLGRPRADEERTRVAQPRDGRLERFDIDGEVLGAIGVDEVDRRVEGRGEDDPAVIAQGRGEDRVAGRARQLDGDLAFDRIGKGDVGRDQDRRGVRAGTTVITSDEGYGADPPGT
jgi:hypothetical protein